MQMQQIRYFVAIAETLNFTRAAERCNVTQPALTRAIRALEEELGGALINRARANTHLTELGRLMEPYFRSILDQSESARSSADQFLTSADARLRVGVLCTIGPALVSTFIADFSNRHEDVAIELDALDHEALKGGLLKGALDVALMASPAPFGDEFHAMPLFEERFAVAMPHCHRLANSASVPCAELDGERYVNRANCEYYDAVSAVFAERGIKMREVFSSECDDWVVAMIKAATGVGLFPEFTLRDPDIILRPLTDPAFSRSVGIVTMRGRRHSPAVGAFVREAKMAPWPMPADEEAAAPAELHWPAHGIGQPGGVRRNKSAASSRGASAGKRPRRRADA